MLVSRKSILTEIARRMFDQISGYLGPARLTHKMTQQRR